MTEPAQLLMIKTGLGSVQAAQQLQQFKLRIIMRCRWCSQQHLCPLQQGSDACLSCSRWR